MKYSDQIALWLKTMGYTHCFYVGGGNIMHLTESINKYMRCIPVIHEVAAGIAAEYFNEASDKGKAFALVTAGPGLTNIVTAASGAFLESRDLLIIGGQVKTSDLSRGHLRQRGIQEIDGVSLMQSITIKSKLIDRVVDYSTFFKLVKYPYSIRPGPVFLEIPIDIQAKTIKQTKNLIDLSLISKQVIIGEKDLDYLVTKLNNSERPAILIGGGVNRHLINKIRNSIKKLKIPIMTTWNGADRVPSDFPNYVGRPNTWGQRSANLIIQQCDTLLAIGTRLGMQQTGFNWKKFLPNSEIFQIDIDQNELTKGHPKITKAFLCDANNFLERFLAKKIAHHNYWLKYCKTIRSLLPLVENVNSTRKQYISPYDFVQTLSLISSKNDQIIPCSSGGAFTVMMQVFELKTKQKMITNKGLASMGYGLSGAIGASVANKSVRTILVEGDGGFSQNIQELGTVAINKLNIKIFIFDDSGYASIRATQKNYFNGSYIGCDKKTGLGLPDWKVLFKSWNIPSVTLNKSFASSKRFNELFLNKSPAAFIVKIDPNQTYFPKISSRVVKNGSMESNPLHLMSPDLPKDIYEKVSKFI